MAMSVDQSVYMTFGTDHLRVNYSYFCDPITFPLSIIIRSIVQCADTSSPSAVMFSAISKKYYKANQHVSIVIVFILA